MNWEKYVAALVGQGQVLSGVAVLPTVKQDPNVRKSVMCVATACQVHTFSLSSLSIHPRRGCADPRRAPGAPRSYAQKGIALRMPEANAIVSQPGTSGQAQTINWSVLVKLQRRLSARRHRLLSEGIFETKDVCPAHVHHRTISPIQVEAVMDGRAHKDYVYAGGHQCACEFTSSPSPPPHSSSWRPASFVTCDILLSRP